MKYDFTLTSEQQALVEDNLSVIGKTINLFIHPDEEVEGLGQDDLYQEGAIALCKAAVQRRDPAGRGSPEQHRRFGRILKNGTKAHHANGMVRSNHFLN